MAEGQPEIRDITPTAFRCIVGACPGILETETEYLVIGRVLSQVAVKAVSGVRVGLGEAVVAVPKGLLQGAVITSPSGDA